MANARTRKAADGFTLVEVLLAVVILSVGLTALLTGAARCIAVMKTAKSYQDAIWTLNKGEAEHPLTVVTNDIKSLEVSNEEYPNGFSYSREVEDDEDEDGLYVVRARATWSEKGRESKEEVVSYVMYLENKK